MQNLPRNNLGDSVDKLKLAGLLVLMCGLQVQPAFAVAGDPGKCLENYGHAERDLARRITELNEKKGPAYIVMTVSGGGYLYCLSRVRSVSGVVGCTGVFGLIGATGYGWNEAVTLQIKKTQDSASIMRIYSAIKNGQAESSDAVINLMRELRVDVRHEVYVLQNVVREMEKGSLCDPYNVPNVSFEDFQSFVRPGDL